MLEPMEVFSGISGSEFARICTCFHARRQVFKAHGCILRHADEPSRVGVILAGRAELTCTDADGRNVVIEQLEKGSIFGAVFMPDTDGMMYSAMAAVACEVLFFDYEQLVRQCPNACEWHTRLISNTLILTAWKTQVLAEHISLLTKRTIRERLHQYFRTQEGGVPGRQFRIPMTLTALADYLGVDRSAMMREMRRMSDDGMLSFKGREIQLLAPQQ